MLNCFCSSILTQVYFFAVDYDLAYQQIFQNIIHVKSNSRATFNILYEELPNGIDLNREKFLHQATLSLDLEGFSIRDLSAEIMSPNYPDFYPNSADLLVVCSGSSTLSSFGYYNRLSNRTMLR